MKRFVVVAFAALCLAAGSAQAAEPVQASAPVAAAPSPKALALTRRYLAALHMKDNFRPMMNGLMKSMLDQQTASSELKPEQRALVVRAVTEAFDESMQAGMLDKMMEAMVPSMATVFSEDELQALVDFYEGPKGQAIVGKMPAFGQVAGVEMMKFMPEMQADLKARVTAKMQALAAKGK